jgi:hypothetical protein
MDQGMEPRKVLKNRIPLIIEAGLKKGYYSIDETGGD